VIIGHLDTARGPAVFFRLSQLRTKDAIFVEKADGTTAVFTIQRIERHRKDHFPTQAVYGSTPDPQLRLITCGGSYDRQAHRYRDNIIAYAVQAHPKD
jgi:sortase (surface protein transpeptidase)